MDENSLISKLADFDRITGSQFFTNGIRELVKKYSQVSTKYEVDITLEDIVAECNYSGVPEEEILALIDSSPYSLKTIETVVKACVEMYVLLESDYIDIVKRSEDLFRDIGMEVMFPLLSSRGPYIECNVPDETPADISFGVIFTKVGKFEDLCKLYQQFPYAFLRFRMENPDEQPLQKALVFLLSLIRQNGDVTYQDIFVSRIGNAYAVVDAQISYKNQIYADIVAVLARVSGSDKAES